MPLTCDTHPGENTIEIVAAGTITDAEIGVATQKVAGFIDRHGEINVIEIVRDHAGTDPSELWSRLRSTPRFRRVAVVTDCRWQSRLAQVQATEFRTFPMDQIDVARIWAHRGR